MDWRCGLKEFTMRPALVWLTRLLGIATAVLLLSFQAPQALDGGSVTATYTRGILHASIPYAASRTGAGQLTVEVLDPEGQTLASIEQAVEIAVTRGTWQEDLKLTKALATEELVWDRLLYQFVYDGEKQPAIKGIDSISQVLRMPVMHIL